MNLIKRTFFLLCCLVIAITIGGCNNLSQTRDILKPTEITVVHEFLGLRMKAPSDWHLINLEEKEIILDDSLVFKTGDKLTFEEINKKERRFYDLICTMKENAVPFILDPSPSVSVLYENIRAFPTIKSGKDYLMLFKQWNSYQTPMQVLEKGFEQEEIGAISYDVMNAYIDVGESRIHRKFYATIRENYVVLFIVAYKSDLELDTVHKILETVTMGD